MFDVFYFDTKPDLFAHERAITDIQQAYEQSTTEYFWIVSYLADYKDFDFLWTPPPWQKHHRHAWASQWQKDSGTYLIHRTGFQETNFHVRPVITRKPDPRYWSGLNDTVGWDLSWHPDPSEPAYIYEFGTRYHNEGGPCYHSPGATERKYIDHPRAELTPRPDLFVITDPRVLDFDFSWRPHPRDPAFIYKFASEWWPAEKLACVEYRAPGATAVKHMLEPQARLQPQTHWIKHYPCEWDESWVPDPGDTPFIYVFGNQWWPANKMPTVEYHVAGAVEKKYMDWPQAKLLPCRDNWTVPEGIDADTIDFSWVPDPGDPAYIYQFATQHQKTGGPIYHVPGATEIKYLDELNINIDTRTGTVVEIDHMDGNAGLIPGAEKTFRFFGNYLDTLKRIANNLVGHEYVWICSSLCDYTDFDFTWHPEQWQSRMLHVFASDDQKFGDTFYMHVPSFKDRSQRCQLLDWYDINFVDRPVPRRALPVLSHEQDTHVDYLRKADFKQPLVVVTCESKTLPQKIPAVSVWRDKTRAVTPLDAGACHIVVPRDIIGKINEQIYDFDFIDRKFAHTSTSKPLDIVFISNGEPNADQNWGALLHSKQGSPNRCVRVDGVNGRAAAYHAAAEASETAWFFAVFAKLEVLANFDWSWQPDRLQQPKHYIFHALNPVNMLEYGHQAMIAYNRQLTLANPGRGLDFTLDDAHEVVPILSGVARYNIDAWTAWRTAFREVIKLRVSLPDVESEYRIRQWQSKSNGPHGEWSCHGAEDALDYYDEVKGDFAELRKSYEWSWLASYALVRRNLAPGH